ncbi:MAG: DUF6573 family protein [Opitutaceae bacterium]|jgi:hypothetical protein
MKSEIQSDSDSVFGDVIYSYSREQALLDGVLVDLSDFEVIRTHWKMPVACTAGAWAVIQDALENCSCGDIARILHDLSCMAKRCIGRQSGDTLYFKCIVGVNCYDFKLNCGPGDDPRPVLSLLLLHED